MILLAKVLQLFLYEYDTFENRLLADRTQITDCH